MGQAGVMLVFLSVIADFVFRFVVLFALLSAGTHLQKIDRIVQRLDTVARHTSETTRQVCAIEKRLASAKAACVGQFG